MARAAPLRRSVDRSIDDAGRSEPIAAQRMRGPPASGSRALDANQKGSLPDGHTRRKAMLCAGFRAEQPISFDVYRPAGSVCAGRTKRLLVARDGGVKLEPRPFSAQAARSNGGLLSPSAVKPRVERAVARRFPELAVAGFSRLDGAMNFYGFVNALLRPEMVVVDFGAGRGGLLEYREAPYRTNYSTIRGKVAKVIGVDIDPIVGQNPLVDEAVVIEPGGTMPLQDHSVDVIISVSTFEHITQPEAAIKEFLRILRPGGWVCASTPNKNGYIALGARLVPNKLHKRVLRWMQPQRPSLDVFPTAYRLNTRADVRAAFSSDDWDVIMFPWNNEPCYLEDNELAVRLLALVGKYAPNYFQMHWHMFIRKKGENH